MNRPARNPWLHCPRPLPDPSVRLFCLPHGGGSAILYHQWPAHLPPQVEVQAVQLPGRGLRLREPPYDRSAPLVQALAQALKPALDGAPFAFFGHSLGALLAYELTHVLREEGLQPQALFASASHAPQLLPPGEILHRLSRPALIEALKRLEGTPPELLDNADILDIVLPTLRADMAVLETYVYEAREPLSCTLIACAARRDTRVAPWQVEAWRQQAAGPFEYHLFEGGHFYLNDVLPQLGQLIARVLTPE